MTVTELALEVLQARREYEVARHHGDAEAMEDAQYMIRGGYNDAFVMNIRREDLDAEVARLEREGY